MTTPIIKNTILGTAFADTIIGQNGSDEIAGQDGDDIIKGGGGSDLLLGGEGNDNIDGGTGQDFLYGGLGNDILVGGAGGDWLSGDKGADSLKGGTGADVFYFNGHTAGVDGSDTILDFNAGQNDTLSFGKFAEGTYITFVQGSSSVFVYSNTSINPTFAGPQNFEPTGTLIATVLNANVNDVQSHSTYDFIV